MIITPSKDEVHFQFEDAELEKIFHNNPYLTGISFINAGTIVVGVAPCRHGHAQIVQGGFTSSWDKFSPAFQNWLIGNAPEPTLVDLRRSVLDPLSWLFVEYIPLSSDIDVGIQKERNRCVRLIADNGKYNPNATTAAVQAERDRIVRCMNTVKDDYKNALVRPHLFIDNVLELIER